MTGLVRTILVATRWPLAACAFLVAFNAKAGAEEAAAGAFPDPPCMTLTST